MPYATTFKGNPLTLVGRRLEEGHHPTQVLSYRKVKITLTTHAAGGLTENDFILANIIDKLGI